MRKSAEVMVSCVDRITKASLAEHITSALQEIGSSLGFEHTVLVGVQPASNGPLENILGGNFPSEWLSRYNSENHLAHDPVVKISKHSETGIVWRRMSSEHVVSKRSQRVMLEATEFGLHDGFTVPVYNADGSQSLVSFGGPVVDLGIEDLGALEVVSIFGANRLRQIALAGVNKVRRVADLTPRELECVQWVSDGKTNWEIAQILGVSEKTVQHLLSHASAKLNSVNRTQLAVSAIRERIIS